MQQTFENLVAKIQKTNPSADIGRIRAAFEYALKAHEGQLRRDGRPFVSHPLAVAGIIAEMGLDTDSIMAGLLHDCVEDTEATGEDLKNRFGPDVAALVDGVTRLGKITYRSQEEAQMEDLRKMFLAMAKDIRVILIKLADRLHNMRTIGAMPPDKQRKKALETMEIYAPIAHRLGMQRVKWELDDLSLACLDPVGYREIQEGLKKRAAQREKFLDQIKARIKERLDEAGIKAQMESRIKHIYSIYRKMYTQQKTMDEIYDICAVRIIVDTVTDCYNVLGLIHDLYRPIPGRFKDYIGTPKPNMYRSLHTTVIGREGSPFEVQIRTFEMHHMAEYGVAAHWKYKQGLANDKLGTEEAFEWVRKLLENQQDTDAEEYVRTLKVDMFADEVFVFTPRGDVVNLPAGATPIDFAYSIHSAVGNAMTGAKVNGRIVTFDYQLQSGDIVEVITSKSAHGPSRDWMKICKSNEARNKIKQWFKKERREENIVTGRSMFESELKRTGISLAAITSEEVLPHLLKKVGSGSLDDLYAAIGYGGMTAQKAVNRIRDELGRLTRDKNEKAAAERLASEGTSPQLAAPAKLIPGARRSESGIIVEGLDNCLVKFAKCCAPVPGDPVVGFITRGFGVSVHRQDCPNADPARRKPEEEGRWVKVSWGESELASYQTSLEISAKDRDALALDVTMALTAAKVKVQSFSARSLPDGYAMVSIVLEVRDRNELTSLINKLGQISGVYQVKRATG